MSRILAYTRVSTIDQETANQLLEIKSAGYSIEPHRYITGRGIRLIVLQLGNLDLTSSSGALMIKVLSAVADFERSLSIERVQAGLARAKAENKKLGRPSKTSACDQQEIIKQLALGVTVSQLARDYAISRASVIKIREDFLINCMQRVTMA
jgi:DNA invertase Pin-like site-specific DNA recombinase